MQISRRRRNHRALNFRLAPCEALESRQMLTTFWVGTNLEGINGATDCENPANTTCSIREAIDAANLNSANPEIDVIKFNVAGSISMASTTMEITDDVIIDGPGASELEFRPISGAIRFFNISGADEAIEVAIQGLSFKSALNSAIVVNDDAGFPANLSLDRTAFALNFESLTEPGTVVVRDGGSLEVQNSSFFLSFDSAIYAEGAQNVEVVNTTFSNSGVGISVNQTANFEGRHLTVAEGAVAGIRVDIDAPGGTTTNAVLENSIIDGNAIDVEGAFNEAESGFNFVSVLDRNSSGLDSSSSIFGEPGAPLSAQLADRTAGAITGYPLYETSPAIDKAPTILMTDQFGQERPIDLDQIGNDGGTLTSDMGAIEVTAPIVATPVLNLLDTDRDTLEIVVEYDLEHRFGSGSVWLC